jgi:hypothetical protein
LVWEKGGFMDLFSLLQILITNPLTVIFAALGSILIALAIIGKIPPINIVGKRAIGLGLFGGVLIILAIGLSWLLSTQGHTNQVSNEIFQEQNGLVVMEAEHFTGTRPGAGDAIDIEWKPITTIDGYSGTSAMQALPDKNVQPENYTNGPALLFDIEFKTPGTYYVFIRGYAPDYTLQGGDDSSGNDSIHVGLNGKAVTVGEGIGLTGFNSSNFSWQRYYAYKNTQILTPQPGKYTFYLWMREDGTVIDKILLSTNPDVVGNDDKGFGPNESRRIP